MLAGSLGTDPEVEKQKLTQRQGPGDGERKKGWAQGSSVPPSRPLIGPPGCAGQSGSLFLSLDNIDATTLQPVCIPLTRC